MLLAIDVGNTHTVLGLYRGAVLQAVWRAATGRPRSAGDWAALLTAYLATRGWAPADVGGCVIGSVVPAVTPALAAMSARLLGVPALRVGSGLVSGVRLAVDAPWALGADRLANVVAAFAAVGGPCIVVDCGTATKCEAVAADGVYLGGAIAPGLRTAAAALADRAALLAPVALVAPTSAVGTTTVAAQQAGLVFGAVALIEGLVGRMRAELAALGGSGPIPVLATGGLAPLLAPHTALFTHLVPTLTLDGLRILYALNS